MCLVTDSQSIARMWLQGYTGRFGSEDICSYIVIPAKGKNWNSQLQKAG